MAIPIITQKDRLYSRKRVSIISKTKLPVCHFRSAVRVFHDSLLPGYYQRSIARPRVVTFKVVHHRLHGSGDIQWRLVAYTVNGQFNRVLSVKLRMKVILLKTVFNCGNVCQRYIRPLIQQTRSQSVQTLRPTAYAL